MEFRDLREGDFQSFAYFVTSMYAESPRATWFEKEPDEEELNGLFDQKLNGIRNRQIVDMVAVDRGDLVAECEIVKTASNYGYLGILVRADYRRQGLGTKLLDECTKKAKNMGITTIQAEVVDENDNALAFMEKAGFITIKTQQNTAFRDHKLNLVLMEKKL